MHSRNSDGELRNKSEERYMIFQNQTGESEAIIWKQKAERWTNDHSK